MAQAESFYSPFICDTFGAFYAPHYIASASYGLKMGFYKALSKIGFVLEDVSIEGRTHTSIEDILAAVALEDTTPILAINLEDSRRQLENLIWVEQATIKRTFPNLIHIALRERQASAILQHISGEQFLIDKKGIVIMPYVKGHFDDLPFVKGVGGQTHIAHLINMFENYGYQDIKAHIRLYERVDNHRWVLHLENGGQVLLPEDMVLLDTQFASPNEPRLAQALTRLAHLDEKNNLLEKEAQIIDLRFADKVIFRPLTIKTKSHY